MAVDIRFLGQACFELKAGGTTVLTDPFLTGNPLAAATAAEVEPDVILLTHGHGDHLGDTVDIAKRTGATVVAIVELAAEISGDGVAEAYSVTGEWDFVAMLRVRDPAEVAEVVTHRFAALDGIKKTQTMVAFEVFSQHDLEALFSIGT